ncbi:hypothetical protein GLYMA_05G006200v4 [Glycine max]|nr:hypothetical protein GLYMA_05G006200v4 [Glycine max]KAH1132180.1 hypothetical protein GYH30_011175 [Glycine max]
MVLGSEQEKEVREVLGGLRSEEGSCGVTVNGDGFSSIESEGLCCDGVVDFVVENSSVLETKVSVLSENDCQVLADSEVNGVPSWLGMQESDMDAVFSGDGAEKLDFGYGSEKLDYMFASESTVPEAAVLSVNRSVEVGGEDGRGGKSEETGTFEDCDGGIVAVGSESRVAEASVSSVEGLVGVSTEDRRGGMKEEEGIDENCDEDAVATASESRAAEAAVLSVDNLVRVVGEDGSVEGINEEDGKDVDCDGNIVAVASESREAEASILSVDSLIGIGGEVVRDGGESEEVEKDEDCNGNILTLESESRVAEAADLIVDSSVGLGGEDKTERGESEEEEKDEDCGGNIVTIEVPVAETSENMDVDVEDLSVEGYGFVVGDFVWGQVESHPSWPGRIYDPSDESYFALRLKQKNRLLVAYFGNGTFAWCQPSQLKPFGDNFDDMVKQNSSIDFASAVQEAVNEFGRLLHLKLSHPFVAKKTGPESSLPLAKNSGIKEGVLVPENAIERLDFLIEPAELLSYVKQISQIIEFGSILELEILKAQLSAYYLSKGGYKLADYMDPQPIPGVEDSVMDETVAGDDGKSTVEAPTQGPFDELGHSPGLSGSISNPVRKQKSIAEIMGEDKDVHTANRELDATVEMVNAIGSNVGKKRKGSEDGMASKPVQKKMELLLDADGDVSCAKNDGNGDEGNSDVGSLLQSKEKKEAFDEGKSEERNEKGNLSRERKRSKYLSPPFTIPTRGQREVYLEPESLKVSRKAKVSQRRAGDAGLSSLPVYKGRFFDGSSYQTREDDGKNIVDPNKIQAPVAEVLSQVLNAAISPLIRREGTSLDQFVDFTYAFRSSLYCQGSLHEVYEKNQPGRKRKKPESEEDEMLKGLNLSADEHISSLKQNSGQKKRRKETASGKKGTDKNAAGAVLFVSFWPGSSMPSRSDLVSVYSKFGALNEAETDMFCTNYTARVSFLRTSDAEKAYNHSQNNNPFGSPTDVTFQLQYSSDGSKSGQQGERSKNKSLPAATAPVAFSQGTEASKLIFIQQKLQGMTLMLEASGGKSPDMMAKVESEMKALLEDVNKMVEASLF